MVASPNNFQSIVGGIFRGLSNNRSSSGLNQTNTQNSSNPLTYQWVGFPTGNLAQPIQGEQTQNPSLPFEKGSVGTNIPYQPPVITDIPTIINQGSPGTNVSIRDVASSAGSQTNIPSGWVPINNAVGTGFGMMPQNADHFKTYFANQIGLMNNLPKASAKTTSLAIAEQQHLGSAGSSDSWKSTYQTFNAIQKGYNPMAFSHSW